jgi:hypothetical protein
MKVGTIVIMFDTFGVTTLSKKKKVWWDDQGFVCMN